MGTLCNATPYIVQLIYFKLLCSLPKGLPRRTWDCVVRRTISGSIPSFVKIFGATGASPGQ